MTRPPRSLAVALPLLAAALGVGGALLAPPFRLQTIQVEGARSAVRADVEAAAWAFAHERAVLAGSPRLLLVPPQSLAEELRRTLPRLADVAVLRRLPGTLVLHLQEKVPLAYLEASSGIYALDREGRVIEVVGREDARRTPLPVVRVERSSGPLAPGSGVLSTAVVDLLHDVIVLLPDQVGAHVASLTIPSAGTREVRVETDRGWILLMDAERNLPAQLRTFEQLLVETLSAEDQERLESVDLRVPGKVFYRLR